MDAIYIGAMALVVLLIVGLIVGCDALGASK
ncbi:MAG: hypothetical protein JWP52_3490 [Rhizobacter sp.]|nr:hypothetical protein [Rhizobacter sp.]